MKRFYAVLLFGALSSASPLYAADALKFGSAPDWIVPQSVPVAPDKTKDLPAALLLHDQQTLFEPGKISTYSKVAFKIQKPEGLAAGNLSLSWNPATDTITVHRLEIRRGSQAIDVLASGQKFTTMRRETDLDLATLDGVLTANIQPEGLQEGDIVVLETTDEHADPVLKGHVETTFASWADAQIALAHARLTWPSNLAVRIQKTGELPSPLQVSAGNRRTYDLTMHDTEPVIAPKGAPVRFAVGRMGEATDFRSWSEAAALMKPLYDEAAIVPPSGPLRDEVESIRKSSADPVKRAEQALALVQNRVRYVALLMGQGGYVPASAETTWSRRFGDCKAKTALILAILHELQIPAEAVMVNTKIGDAIGERLPMIGLFNHVLVRAHIGSKDYWLDGTRTGDSNLAEIEIPNFGWGLPLVPDASLVHLVPAPYKVAQFETAIDVDARGGAFAPATIKISSTYRDDAATYLNSVNAQLSSAQRDQWLHQDAEKYFDAFTPTASNITFDKTEHTLTIVENGSAKLNWREGWLYVPGTSVAYNPDFDRPPGPFHDAPFATTYPSYSLTRVKIHLPAGFAAQQKLPAPVHETLAGVEYSRNATIEGNDVVVQSSERSIAQEVAYKDAVAAAARLKGLNDDDVYLRIVTDYTPTPNDLKAVADSVPGSAAEYLRRGNLYLDYGKFAEALSDFTKALSFDPQNKAALADQAIAYVWLRKFDDASKAIDTVLKSDPDNAVALRALALKAEIAGDYSSAVDAYGKSLKSDPDSGFAIGHRAICEYQLGRQQEALSDTDLALKKNPTWGELRLIRLELLARSGQAESATNEQDRFIKDNAITAAAAWVSVAQAYARAGLESKAIDAFAHALALKPDPSLYIARAAIRAPSDYNGRMADLDAALKLEPTDSGALAAKAQLIASRGDLHSALAVYEQAMRTVRGQSPLSLGRALILYRMGRKSEAERLLNDWRRSALTATELNEICWGKASAGILLESAALDCNAALHINQDYAPAIDSLAFVKLRLGKFDEAIALYDRAIAKRASATSYMGRALAYARKGDDARARTDRERAIREDPNVEAVFADYGLKLDAVHPAHPTAAHQ
ncbi:MAG TPA: tetratricopeptide repeat protein [Sphingomicrobium sp.]|nr:tetratricopeptide repeat protein [Sphingomicrobium sp.]